MSSKNLSQLTSATASSGSDLFYLVQSGTDKSITFTALQTALGGGGMGANQALSNLTSTSINMDLVPGGSGRVLGSSSLPWQSLWVSEIIAPGQIDFQLTTGHLYNNSGSFVADFTANLLSDNSQIGSVDWQNRRLDSSNGSSSVDWNNRALSDGVIGAQLSWTSAGIGLPQLTATTVPYLNGSNILTSSAVTPTELGYVSGVSSAIQGQLNFITAHGIITDSGQAILVSGTVTVSSAAVTPSTLIMLTTQSVGGTIGIQYISARVTSTSFTITSNSSLDTSTVAYVLIEP